MFWRPRASGDRSPWGNWWFEPVGMHSAAGMRITGDNAMRLAAVYACVNILAKTFAVLTFNLYKTRTDGGRDKVIDHPLYRLLAKRPNAFQNPFEWWQMLMGHLALRGNSYNRIFTAGDGTITDLIPLHPDRVRIDSLPNGEYRYKVRDQAGLETIVPRGEIWHMRWLSSDGIVGVSPIDCARETVGIGLASQEYGARFFMNDARPGGGWIEHPSIFKDTTARDNFRAAWQKSQAGGGRHRTAVLEGGMKYHDLPINNEQAQFLETRQFSVSDIARIFGVPPHLVGDLSKATFSNIEQQSLEFVIYTMTPICEAWEASIEYSLLEDGSGLDPEFDLDRLLRGDHAARGEFYNKLFQVGALSTNEIRLREGDNPVPNGDQRFVPVNLQTLENATAPPEPAPAGAASKPAAAVDVTRLVSSDAPAEKQSDRIAAAAVDRVIRKELEMRKAGKAVFDIKHAQFVAEVLAVPLGAAKLYCQARTAVSFSHAEDFEAHGRSMLLALARGET